VVAQGERQARVDDAADSEIGRGRALPHLGHHRRGLDQGPIGIVAEGLTVGGRGLGTQGMQEHALIPELDS
jgi:hypothetical protein